MGIPLAEITRLLLSGKTLEWPGYKDQNPGSITLNNPSQRRLFEFLLNQDSSKVAVGDENIFPGLISAWENNESDPANFIREEDGIKNNKSWRLYHIEAYGFGGLTIFKGKCFDLYVGGHNWCLEGQNGSGKTSLVSSILWALTGKRIREHEGPVDERGEREDVVGDDGRKVGRWPPLAAYPTNIADLNQPAEVWVKLTFKAADGEPAIAFRRMISPPIGEATLEEQIDPRLKSVLRLADIGILMPARLAKIGFGKNSLTLYEAVKQLTGLDQLSDIADGCTAFGALNRKFMKYAKDQGIDGYERRFSDAIKNSRKYASEFDFKIPIHITIDRISMEEELSAASKNAFDMAGTHLVTLKNEIPPFIDTKTVSGRDAVKAAVSSARGLVMQGPKAISLFQTWKALTDAASDQNFANLPSALIMARSNLEKALEWHHRQTADGKLRLKALAALNFTAGVMSDPNCPLCDSPLNDESGRILAAELQELRENAATAEQKIGDACRGIYEDLSAFVPEVLRNHRIMIDGMDPAEDYAAMMEEKFVAEEPFSDVLIGLGAAAKSLIEKQRFSLPRFEFPERSPPKEEPAPVDGLRQEIHAVERLMALVGWWTAARPAFLEAWSALVGRKRPDGSFPSESIEGKLSILEQALAHARPLEDLSSQLNQAVSAARSWKKIDFEQKKREKIRNSLEPLKQLRTLVSSETSRSISNLSDSINDICKRICLRERLEYKEAVVGRKEVNVTGSFSPGMHIDAAMVANTSWLRAILWSFIFALRQETLNGIGFNPLPLIVLDDPQGTFDPRNKRKWAQELVLEANKAHESPLSSQLIITTHERHFYQILIEHEKFKAQQGLIGGVNKISEVATIANGGELQRLYDEAQAEGDDKKAREYIRKVRIYCEDLIKFMLRSISNEISDMTLGKLRNEIKALKQDHIAPFDRKAFSALISALDEGKKAMKYINQPHHIDDETYGVAEADVVKNYWDSELLKAIHLAFSVFDTFNLYTGEPRTFPWAKTVVTFPEGNRNRVKASVMKQTGVAAAAKTDGRFGDGILTVTEWDSGEDIVLPNHDAFQLSAGTLDPVAGVGDIIIVNNYAKVHSRNLVVASFEDKLLARRLSVPDDHSQIAVLTGQSVDPYDLPPPIIVPLETNFRKIVGTLFTSHLLQAPPIDSKQEFIPLPDASILDRTLKGARLFKVEGRSAEPIALDGQYLITRHSVVEIEHIKSLDGRLVIGIDEDGARYFKRLRCIERMAILESLNSSGTTGSEIFILDDSQRMRKLTQAIEVIGVLFETPG